MHFKYLNVSFRSTEHQTPINEEITRLMDSRLNLNTEMTFILNLINDSTWFMAVKSRGPLGKRKISYAKAIS
ncbi:UNVERIFIED_ORG: hypothetical protein J2W64_004774 [Rahnella aquatilis]|nr:hypothetical protein [Rahnella aquatilis]